MLKKITFYLTLLYLTQQCFGITTEPHYTKQVVDTNAQPVAYCSIAWDNGKMGVYSDSSGTFSFDSTVCLEQSDTVYIRSIGYKTQKIPLNDFKEKNTFILEQKTYSLKEVSIRYTPKLPINLGYNHFKTTKIGLTGNPGSYAMVYIPNTTSGNPVIQSINVRLKKARHANASPLRFFISYADTTGENIVDLLTEPLIMKDLTNKMEIDVSQHNIPLPENGVMVGIQWIGNKNSVVSKKDLNYPSLACTNSYTKLNTFIGSANSFERFIINPDELPNFLLKLMGGMIQNASIGITVK